MVRKTVLVVEKDEPQARMLEAALKRPGADGSVIVVSSPDEAALYLHHRRELGAVPALLLLDLGAHEGGLDLLRSIKSHERTKGIPVVMLSNDNEEIDVRELYRSGANSYLEKPRDANDLADLISAAADYWLGLNLAARN